MTKKKKIGIILILVGVGIPLVLFFFQENGDLKFKNPTVKVIERKLNPKEIEIIEKKREEDKTRKTSYLTYLDEFFGKDYWKKEEWTIQHIEVYLIPYKYSIGIGIALILIGIGMITFSFFPREENSKK